MKDSEGKRKKKKNGRKNAELSKLGRSKTPESNWELLKAKGGLSKRKQEVRGRDTRQERADSQRHTHVTSEPVRGSLTKMLAIDCEMVGAGVGGSISMLARVSIVNSNGQVVYDSYVSPSQSVTDYRTRFSGIRPHHLKNAPKRHEVLQQVRSLVAGRILLGHAIHNDLDVLEIDHPDTHIRDSAKFPRLMRSLPNGKLKPKKLSVLAEEELNIEIQRDDSGHCSVQDARATMALWKKHRKDWENWHRRSIGSKVKV